MQTTAVPGIADKVALITGASSGLGRHFALTLAKAGAHVAVAARRQEPLESLAEEIHAMDRQAMVVPMDVTKTDSLKTGIARVKDELGTVQILVNNAGILDQGPAECMTPEAYTTLMDTNVKSVFLLSSAMVQALKQESVPGSIINIASAAAQRAVATMAAYSASKAAVVHLTRALALEWAPLGIRVNALSPGYMATEINEAFRDSAAGEPMRKRFPRKRYGLPEQLDGALLLFAGDAGDFITGSELLIDDGQTLV